MNKKHSLIALAVIATSGCATIPSEAFLHLDHNSHVLSGRPFESQQGSEDTLDAIGLTTKWNYRTWFYELGLQYPVRDGGYYGDKLLFNGRVAVYIHKE